VIKKYIDMIIDMGYYMPMPYKDKNREKERSIRRRGYFREYSAKRRGNLGYNTDRLYCSSPNGVGIIGEKFFLESFSGSKWVGKPYDGECSYGKVDIKTSKPHGYKSKYESDSKRSRWRFGISRQTKVVDNFILFCLDENSEIVKMLVVPSEDVRGITGITMMVGSHSKYDRYIVPHI
jgi:hypothetical protein